MTQSIKNLPRFTILLFLTYVTCVEIEIDMHGYYGCLDDFKREI